MPPVDFATPDDLSVFLHSVEAAISEKMNRQTEGVKELLLEGYGDITVSLKVKNGKLVVANVLIGTNYNLEREQERPKVGGVLTPRPPR